MAPSFEIPVTVGGLLAAIACVAGGGPLFAFGLRALRSRRAFARLREEPLSAELSGLVRVSGTVGLDSPLFAPLSNQPCAGFTLIADAEGTRIRGIVRQQRTFLLEGAPCGVRVEAAEHPWRLAMTAQRRIAAGEPVSERLAELFEASPELRWLRRSGMALRLSEHALLPHARVHVLAHARVVASDAVLGEDVSMRTGTDDGRMTPFTSSARSNDLVLSDEGHAPCAVADSAAMLDASAPPRWQAAGALLGPLVTMAGLLYLAHAAELLLAQGVS